MWEKLYNENMILRNYINSCHTLRNYIHSWHSLKKILSPLPTGTKFVPCHFTYTWCVRWRIRALVWRYTSSTQRLTFIKGTRVRNITYLCYFHGNTQYPNIPKWYFSQILNARFGSQLLWFLVIWISMVTLSLRTFQEFINDVILTV